MKGGKDGGSEQVRSCSCSPASGDSVVTSVASPSPAEVEADTDTV